MSKIRDNGWLLALILSIASVILIIISLVPPWYHQTSDSEFLGVGMEMEMQYTLWGIKGGVVELVEEDGTISYSSDEMKDKEQAKVFITTSRILAIGLLISFTLIFASISAGKRSILRMRVAVIIALIACILTIMAPLYLMAALPGAFENDDPGLIEDDNLGPQDSFIGSDTDDSSSIKTELTWGPKSGWYLSLIAGILNLMAFITLFWFMKGPLPPAPVQNQAWQQRPYPPQPSQYPPQQPPPPPPPQYPQQPPPPEPQYPPDQRYPQY